MSGTRVIFWKEITDYFGSRKFVILFVIICLTGISIAYLTSKNLEIFAQLPVESMILGFFIPSAGALPSFTFFISFLDH